VITFVVIVLLLIPITRRMLLQLVSALVGLIGLVFIVAAVGRRG
jgi:hypothetical protein